MNPYSPTHQAERRAELFSLIRERFRPLLDDRAHSEKLIWWDQDRVAIWASNAFLAGDETACRFGNTILRYVRDDLWPTDPPGPSVFTASALAGVLALWYDRLEEDVRQAVCERLQVLLPFGTTRDYQFQGFNDNMPVMWTWALCFGGESFDNAQWRKIARANLLQLRDLFRRRGTVSEYGSNYSTHRITGLAHIGEYSRDEEMRELARKCQARVWAEIVGHWHPALGQVCGASMRGAPPVSQEQCALFRQVFGDDICIPALPWRAYYDPEVAAKFGTTRPPESAAPGMLFAYPFGYGAEFASATYTVPDVSARLFYEKPTGFHFQCTAENGHANSGVFCKQVPVYGAGGVLITTRLTDEVVEIPHHPVHGAQPHGLVTHCGRNYALGTSTTNQFETSVAFRCTYRRREAPAELRDFGNVAVRYNINDKVLDGRNLNTYWRDRDTPQEKENYTQFIWDGARHHCLQDENTALCLQVPTWSEYWDVRQLRTDVMLHQELGKVGAVWAGDRKVENIPAQFEAEELITVDEGAVYLAIRPLVSRFNERSHAMTIWESDEFLVLSFYNHDGISLRLSPREMAKLGNGFVFEIRDAAEYSSFGHFQTAMREAKVLDQLYAGVRRVHYVREDLRLSLVVCPYTNTVMQRSVNGTEQVVPKFAFSGDSYHELPFIESTPASSKQDWEWLETQFAREAESYNPVD